MSTIDNENCFEEEFEEELSPELDAELQEEIAAESGAENYIKMDFSIETPEARVEKVKEIIENTPVEKLRPQYLEKLADYIIWEVDKQERKEKNGRKFLTDNRMVTVNRNETSFEGLVGKLENGEDGIYNMITNDKNIIMHPKVSITAEDEAEIPILATMKKDIEILEERAKSARGKNAFNLKKQIIELRQDRYTIKNIYKKPIYTINTVKSFSKLNLEEKININPETKDIDSVEAIISLLLPEHVSALLCNYSKLKQESWNRLNSDAKWLMMDLDNLIDETLKGSYPMYYDILCMKINEDSNADIQDFIRHKYNIYHSPEHISSLWRNKIPNLLAEKAQENYLEWYYTEKELGNWKRCTRCGQIKLANNRFFSKNNASRDHFYSICKCCRNKK